MTVYQIGFEDGYHDAKNRLAYDDSDASDYAGYQAQRYADGYADGWNSFYSIGTNYEG